MKRMSERQNWTLKIAWNSTKGYFSFDKQRVEVDAVPLSRLDSCSLWIMLRQRCEQYMSVLKTTRIGFELSCWLGVMTFEHFAILSLDYASFLISFPHSAQSQKHFKNWNHRLKCSFVRTGGILPSKDFIGMKLTTFIIILSICSCFFHSSSRSFTHNKGKIEKNFIFTSKLGSQSRFSLFQTTTTWGAGWLMIFYFFSIFWDWNIFNLTYNLRWRINVCKDKTENQFPFIFTNTNVIPAASSLCHLSPQMVLFN